MLLQLLAEYDVDSHISATMIKVGIGIVALLVTLIGALMGDEKNDEFTKELDNLSSEELAKKIEEAGKAANGWLSCVGFISCVLVGKHIYWAVQNPADQAGHIEMIASYLVALTLPGLICFALIRHRPLTASLRRLRIATYVSGTSAFLLFAWAGLVLFVSSGLLFSILAIGFCGLSAAMTAFGFSQTRKIRKHINATLGDGVVSVNEAENN